MKTLSRSIVLRPIASLSIAVSVLAALLLAGFPYQIRAQVSAQSPVFPKDKTVVDMTDEELIRHYPAELRHFEFSPNQDELKSLLTKAGERIQTFFENFSNTASKEYINLQRFNLNGGIDSSRVQEYRYLILFHSSENAPLLEEYRTDTKNRPVNQNEIRGFSVTSGYTCLSLNFHPKYQDLSDFRYLGRRNKESKDYVIAFAQKPGQSILPVVYTDTNSGKTVRLPVQGLVWIDPGTYQIVRMLINLLPAANSSIMTEQTTDIRFSETHFEGIEKKLWLPHDVLVTTIIGGRSFRNLHRYSEYQLFGVQSDYKINRPKEK